MMSSAAVEQQQQQQGEEDIAYVKGKMESVKGEDVICAKSKMTEARGSISSVDSSISLSYDAAPFTPRGSLTTSSADEDKPSSSQDSSDGVESAQKVTDNDDGEGFESPDEELTKRIVDQVEYYFSDDNIVKDAFLLKHVRRNKEGFVSLKLIASFKRVKHIAKDWKVVRAALRTSSKLEINEAGTKLRRVDPLPQYDQTTPSRTVVALNMPANKATIESVAEWFRTCGEIALVRILRPGNPIPADVRPFYNKHPEMHTAVSALVEFVRTESAHNALNMECEEGVQVVELNAPATGSGAGASKKRQPGAGLNKKYPANRMFEMEYASSCPSGSETEDLRYKLRMQQRRCSSPHLQNRPVPATTTTGGETGLLWSQRRWSRDSGSESPASNFSRSRSNSGAYVIPEFQQQHLQQHFQQRRLSAGWESSSESYGSCRSRSSSGASIPDVFAMRRYSLPRKEGPDCCCCGGNNSQQRRYSIGQQQQQQQQQQDLYARPNLSRCNSDTGGVEPYRKDSMTDFHRHERRPSLCKNEPWSRNGSSSSLHDQVRRLSDASESPLFRPRSCNTLPPHGTENLVRLPRGPDGGRGFQRDLIEYPLPE